MMKIIGQVILGVSLLFLVAGAFETLFFGWFSTIIAWIVFLPLLFLGCALADLNRRQVLTLFGSTILLYVIFLLLNHQIG